MKSFREGADTFRFQILEKILEGSRCLANGNAGRAESQSFAVLDRRVRGQLSRVGLFAGKARPRVGEDTRLGGEGRTYSKRKT